MLEFFRHRGQIGSDRFLEQLPLLGRQVFSLDAIALAFVIRQLMCQFVDLGPALDEQATQLLGSELVKIGG